ncbi:MAG: tRNA (adenosine(37)-N6)-threonylcarbamoyltransferase complex transferase subunit TsaD [Candidatus Yanofskybacteria bacterium RIFCSPHIGHO2_02_FULL_41_11]|uniref:tRNA N6-adenosine threonylcarbamoyltransferase n=1 Tax=Candidatus Yanofskybacteria bacterium RIFCSPHIGHO2_02_FULL_41_11 TaxID=1802675 RepID=A0A1F8FBG4_9BACT|nr:MAG: tRNA (adenosine(37)-N6)-threonylcarbamoyltransferase complex transferase subunit TsaD [Candidatus Yanofskybacteria bacterium RIFCSPHIGHO2_02_FULL_41_11]
MKILGIETSCDETAVAVVEVKGGEIRVLSNIVSSQVKLHAKFGGIVPNLAAREHVKNIEHVFKLALKEAEIKDFNKGVDLVAVTRGPGLGPSLLVGIAFTRTLAWKYDKPLMGVNHLEGHIYSNWLKPVGATYNLQPTTYNFPILNLIVSGGHTELVLMEDHGKYKVIGETLDDAAGEAFDKVARLLELGYPGGPAISKAAEKGNPNAYPLPSPMIRTKNYNFSYSGLKTAVLYLLRDLNVRKPSSKMTADIAASFQNAALDVLVYKTVKAAQEYSVKSIFLSGGVSANSELRKRMETEVNKLKTRYSQPQLEYTGDNAAMIAIAGYFNYMNMKKPPSHPPLLGTSEGHSKASEVKVKTDWQSVKMDANLSF